LQGRLFLYIQKFMRIVHIAAEFAPIAKTGGLGEVIVGLCRELTKQPENQVEVIIPRYDHIELAKLPNTRMEIPDFKCIGYSNTMWNSTVEGCNLHLLEPRHPSGYFHRGRIYGCEDDLTRFIYFSRAALEYLKEKNEPIDILHLHDWHVSLCAPMLKDLFKEIKVSSLVLSIHNLEYQGKCAPVDLDAIGLDGQSYLTADKLQDDHPSFPTSINLLKGGITYSDAVVPVSPSYAQEILTPKFGFNLDATLRKCRSKITGILNGIDETLWDPSHDPHLKVPYCQSSVLRGKIEVQKEFQLKPTGPWVGAVTRLVPQKGPELIEEALQKTIEMGGSFLLLGSSPFPTIQAHFNQLKQKYQNHPQVFLEYNYNEPLAHKIYAALDYLIVPSHFEPCGLTQLIGMLYGALPIVHATGGLKDTVFDCENSQIPIHKRNGFTFSEPTKSAMNDTLKRAFRLFSAEASTFHSLVRRGMESDFSWKNPTKQYLKLYRKLIKLKSKTGQNNPKSDDPSLCKHPLNIMPNNCRK